MFSMNLLCLLLLQATFLDIARNACGKSAYSITRAFLYDELALGKEVCKKASGTFFDVAFC